MLFDVFLVHVVYIYIYTERINRVFKASRCHSLLSVLIDCRKKNCIN